MDIASYIDHTLLKPDTTSRQIEKLCSEAAEYGFASVCVPPVFVSLASTILRGTRIPAGTVAGFPLGYQCPETKIEETRLLLARGAKEIDMVLQIGKLKEGDSHSVLEEIKNISRICHEQSAILKVIVETALLSEPEKILACKLVCESGADFIKTSTGFSGSGATIKDVQLLYKLVSPCGLKVKAAGGIRSFEFAKALIDAGANRIGSSSGLDIMAESREDV